MKIDIGRGKILGTKRVSPNGQISGFTEYAGQEVLVVLPEGEAKTQPDARDLVDEIKAATQQQMQVAFHEYEGLKDRFQGPNEATKHFLETHAPSSFQGLYDRIERWVAEQSSSAEDRVKRAIELDEEPPTDGRDPSREDRSRSNLPQE